MLENWELRCGEVEIYVVMRLKKEELTGIRFASLKQIRDPPTAIKTTDSVHYQETEKVPMGHERR
jgi:hypothetical protein